MNYAFYEVWKSGMIAGCNRTATPRHLPLPRLSVNPTVQRLFSGPKTRNIHLCRKKNTGMRRLRGTRESTSRWKFLSPGARSASREAENRGLAG